MKVCEKCGAKNEDDYLYCEQCGNMLSKEKTPSSQEVFSKENLSEVADKTISGAKTIAAHLGKAVNDTLESQKEKANEDVQKRIAQAQKKYASKRKISATGTEYMSTTALWSWLQKDRKRQRFFTEEANTLTQEEYLDKLSQKLDENQVPAEVQVRSIQWDRSDVQQKVCCVQPYSDFVNPMSCLVQFDHVGKFTFVEEKTFITPPDLPDVPGKKVEIPSNLSDYEKKIVWGGLALLAGLLFFIQFGIFQVGLILLLIGGMLLWFGYLNKQKLEALEAYNRKCDAQEKAWSEAWENWQNSVFMHSFQENINGQISRIYDSVFECIKQLNKELFSQQVPTEEEENQSLNELEQLIARRKDDYR